MKKFLMITLILFLSDCAIGPVHGFLFTNTSFSGEFNSKNSVLPQLSCKGDHQCSTFRSASGCQRSILYFVTFGNASAGYIASMNKIKRIATIDYSTMSILTFIYSDYCTIITGE